MPLGGLVAILFFLTLVVAALTSSVSLYEVGVAYLTEERKMSRSKAVTVLFIAIWVAGVLCSLSFGPLSEFKILGNTIFDFLDKLSANFLMTLGSLMVVLFVGWKMKKPDVFDEFTNGGTINRNAKMFKLMWPILRYVAPIAILVIFISNLIG